MNILVTGGFGFIGSQIIADLLNEGYKIITLGRAVNQFQLHYIDIIYIQADFSKEFTPFVWQEKLKDIPSIDVIVNCVGVIQASEKQIWNVHYHSPKTLIETCIKKGLKRVIQISALGVDKSEVPFATSKKALDDYLMASGINSCVLRPSLVYGRGSYGGSSLFRGLAGLPGFIPLPGDGNEQFQPIHINDLSKAVLKLIKSEKNKIYTAVGPERITIFNLLFLLRNWLGFGKARKITIPKWLIRIVAWCGDKLNTTVNSTLYKMMLQNNIASNEETFAFQEAIGFIPKKITEVLREPSYVQDRWHARLYFIRPLLRLSIAFLWIFSGFTSLFLYPVDKSIALLQQIGIRTPDLFLYGASFLDFVLGLATLFNYKIKFVGLLQVFVIVFYTAIISIWFPYLWLDPFGPITKNIPIVIAIWIMIALESKR